MYSCLGQNLGVMLDLVLCFIHIQFFRKSCLLYHSNISRIQLLLNTSSTTQATITSYWNNVSLPFGLPASILDISTVHFLHRQQPE